MSKFSSRKLPSYEDALARILDRTPLMETENVPTAQSRGRILRQAVRADRDQPPFDRSAMDGFAVRSAQLGRIQTWQVSGTLAAGAAPPPEGWSMPAHAVMQIATGAALPSGADAVVPVEQVMDENGDAPDPGQERTVRFKIEQVEPWWNVHRQGRDAKAGDVVLRPGTHIGPQHVGIASTVGARSLAVSKLPRICLITSGDEVRPAELLTDQLEPQQIRNSNGPMVHAFLEALGIRLLNHEHVPDEPEQTRASAREALAGSNLVITVGGVGPGQRDWLAGAWEQLGLQTVVHGVSIQPGRPLFVAGPAEADDPRLVMGLPGNPVSVLAALHLFVWPVLKKMQALETALHWRPARLAEPVRASHRRDVFRAATVQSDGTIKVIAWQGSGDLVHTSSADGLTRLPHQDELVPAGTELPFLPLVK